MAVAKGGGAVGGGVSRRRRPGGAGSVGSRAALLGQIGLKKEAIHPARRGSQA